MMFRTENKSGICYNCLQALFLISWFECLILSILNRSCLIVNYVFKKSCSHSKLSFRCFGCILNYLEILILPIVTNNWHCTCLYPTCYDDKYSKSNKLLIRDLKAQWTKSILKASNHATALWFKIFSFQSCFKT